MDGLVQNIVCLDSSNCNQMKAVFHSSWEIPPSCFRFSLYCFQGAFHSVVNCTCSLSFFSIFHFFFTTFVQQPFSATTIQGSLHLICTIMYNKQVAETSKMVEVYQGCVQISSSNKPGYLASWEIRVFRVVRLCSKNNKLFQIENNLMQKRNTSEFLCMKILNCTEI